MLNFILCKSILCWVGAPTLLCTSFPFVEARLGINMLPVYARESLVGGGGWSSITGDNISSGCGAKQFKV